MIAKRKGVVARLFALARGSERSVEQTYEAIYKNRIRGIQCRTSGHMIAKSICIKGTGCKSGGSALKAMELTSGRGICNLSRNRH